MTTIWQSKKEDRRDSGNQEKTEYAATVWQLRLKDEVHFLLKCKEFDKTRKAYFDKLSEATPDFKELDDTSKLRIILGEGNTAHLGAQYLTACHNLRDGE